MDDQKTEETEKPKSWSEQIPNFLAAAREISGKTPVIFIDGSKFDRAAIKAAKSQTAELARQTAAQMDAQIPGSSANLDQETLINVGQKAFSGRAAALANTMNMNMNMAFVVVPDPNTIVKSYESTFLLFNAHHIKPRTLTFEMAVEAVAVHEITHAFHEGKDGNQFVINNADERRKILGVLRGEIPADMNAHSYLQRKYGNQVAQEYLDKRTMEAWKDPDHATSFFIGKMDADKITDDDIYALKNLSSSLTYLIETELKVGYLEASKIKTSDPQRFAKIISDAMKKGLPQVIDLDIESGSLQSSMAEKLGIDFYDVPEFIEKNPEKSGKAYEALKAEGITRVPSIYTNPKVVEFMKQYIDTVQRVFIEDTTPDPEIEEPEDDIEAEPEVDKTPFSLSFYNATIGNQPSKAIEPLNNVNAPKPASTPLLA